jgi:hypothetical protein
MTGRERVSIVGALWILCGCAATWAVPSKSYYRTHALHSLDYRVAETLAWGLCREIGSSDKDPGKVAQASDHSIVLLGPPEAHARLVEILAERDPLGRPVQRFEVYLVRGQPERSGATVGSLPPGVVAALQGLKEFLPTTGFEIVASGSVETGGRGEVRLAGKGDESYIVSLDYRGRRTGRGPGTLFVDVAVRSLAAGVDRAAARDVVTSSLSLDVGETIVVGSSGGSPMGREVLVLLLAATR